MGVWQLCERLELLDPPLLETVLQMPWLSEVYRRDYDWESTCAEMSRGIIDSMKRSLDGACRVKREPGFFYWAVWLVFFIPNYCIGLALAFAKVLWGRHGLVS